MFFALVFVLGCGSGMVPSGATPIQSGSARVLQSIAISPGPLVLSSGEFLVYRATGLYSDGSSSPLTQDLTWSSSSASATINSAGLMETGGAGESTIEARSGLISAAVPVEVVSSAPTVASFGTSVAPLPGEDLSEPCTYQMLLPNSAEAVRGMLVIFDRGDTGLIWQDPELQTVARRLGLGLVYANQCHGLTYWDVQSEGELGPARALTTALGQFSVVSGHLEIAKAPLVLFGFSATGVLSITSAEQISDRILTVVAYAPGSGQLVLADQTPTSGLEATPMLVLGNADDQIVGTSMGEGFFQKGRAAGAPWAFAVQPGMPHCCVLTSAPLLYAWLDAVVPLREGGGANGPAAIAMGTGLAGKYTCTANGVVDSRGYTDCGFTSANVTPLTAGDTSSSWLPDAVFGQAWMRWVGEGS